MKEVPAIGIGAAKIDHEVDKPLGVGAVREAQYESVVVVRRELHVGDVERPEFGNLFLSLAFSSRDDRLASVNTSGSLAVWNDGQATSGDHSVLGDCNSLASFSPDSRQLFVRLQNFKVARFDVATNEPRNCVTFPDGFDRLQDAMVSGIAPLADQRVLTLHHTAEDQSIIEEWNLGGQSSTRRVVEIPAECRYWLVTPDERHVLTVQNQP